MEPQCKNIQSHEGRGYDAGYCDTDSGLARGTITSDEASTALPTRKEKCKTSSQPEDSYSCGVFNRLTQYFTDARQSLAIYQARLKDLQRFAGPASFYPPQSCIPGTIYLNNYGRGTVRSGIAFCTGANGLPFTASYTGSIYTYLSSPFDKWLRN